MKTIMFRCVALLLFLGLSCAPMAQNNFEKDTIETSAGPIEITFFGHATLMLEFGGKVFQVDPWSKLADYTKLPKADFILITHDHFDHCDPGAVSKASKDDTVIIANAAAAQKVKGAKVMKNGDSTEAAGVKIEAVPAYNLVHERAPGQPYHPKGAGNGYVLTMCDKHVYIAGDTENIPEMKALKNIDVAFLPMNFPYTMTPEMVADAAKAFKPKVLYPYHFGETDVSKLVDLLKDTPEIEVRVRKME